jgi:hypothetical protein
MLISFLTDQNEEASETAKTFLATTSDSCWKFWQDLSRQSAIPPPHDEKIQEFSYGTRKGEKRKGNFTIFRYNPRRFDILFTSRRPENYTFLKKI